MTAISVTCFAQNSLFDVSRAEFKQAAPLKNKLVILSRDNKDSLSVRLNQLFHDSYVTVAKLDTGRYLETDEIVLPENQGYVMYKVFFKDISSGLEVTILPFIKYNAVTSSMLLGTGQTQWLPAKGKGMYNSLLGHALRGTISITHIIPIIHP
jgi:hypothetical protein